MNQIKTAVCLYEADQGSRETGSQFVGISRYLTMAVSKILHMDVQSQDLRQNILQTRSLILQKILSLKTGCMFQGIIVCLRRR